VDSDYYTDAIVYTQVSELAQFENTSAASVGFVTAAHGEVRVKRQIAGFKKIKFYKASRGPTCKTPCTAWATSSRPLHPFCY
jgi:hypothetical protein